MNALRNLRIGTRLALSFAGVLVLIAMLAVAVYVELAKAQIETQELTVQQTERLQLAAEWRQNIMVNSQRTLAVAYSADKTLAARFVDDIKRMTTRTSEIQKRFAELETTPQGEALQEKLAKARKRYAAHRDLLLSGQADAAHEAGTAQRVAEFKEIVQDYITAAGEVHDYEYSRTEAMGKQVNERLAATTRNLVGTAIGCSILGCVLGWLLSRSIVVPLGQAERAAKRIAGGDLSHAVPSGSKDEVGQLLLSISGMQDALRRLVGDIRSSVEGISVASEQVAAGNQDLSARTEQASANLQQTAASVEEIASTMHQASAAAAEADRLARSASDVAGKGGEAVLRVVTTMGAISESSKRIGDIVGVIEGIAFQTNILALNAAVEAARAGDQGRGFAVVASEVRALAQRSASAAKEIKGLIEESVERVGAGAQEAQTAGRTIEGVVSSVQRVSGIVTEITSAASEQARGIAEVNQAVAQMDRATQQNAALVEESAAAAASLNEQAQALSHSVQRFKLA